MERMLISGVAADKHVARISLIGLQDLPGIAFKIFRVLSDKNINVDVILQSVGRDGTKDISFTVTDTDLEDALKLLEENADRFSIERIEHDEDVAKISIVGAGMMTHAGVATKMFEALYNSGINIGMISTSEIRVSVLIEKKYANDAVRAIHDAFSADLEK